MSPKTSHESWMVHVPIRALEGRAAGVAQRVATGLARSGRGTIIWGALAAPAIACRTRAIRAS